MPGENQLPDESPVALPDLLQYSREFRGDQVLYSFSNGIRIKTEIFSKNDKLRILPLGTPQRSLMNHMLNFPEVVKEKTSSSRLPVRVPLLHGIESRRPTR
jgi:hypothetical protein